MRKNIYIYVLSLKELKEIIVLTLLIQHSKTLFFMNVFRLWQTSPPAGARKLQEGF